MEETCNSWVIPICEIGSCLLSFCNFLEVFILNSDEELEFDSLFDWCDAASEKSSFFDLKSFRDIIIFRLFAFRAIAEAEDAIDDISDDKDDTDDLNTILIP